jgi:hypothetical protein
MSRWDDDDPLFEDLADAMSGIAQVAESVARKGEAAFTWRSVDADLLLASLTFDSSLDAVAERRSDTRGTRVLVFHSSPLVLELEVTSDQIMGQLDPPAAADIVLESADATTRFEADDLGFFVAPRPRGPVRLRCETASARLVTDWVHL